jgi:hypothetical protein
MPVSTITAPVAADPIDRLTLRCDVVRLCEAVLVVPSSAALIFVCMAEE